MATFLLPDNQDLIDCLPELAEDIVQSISTQDPEHSQELLSSFVSQLFLSATKQMIRRERHVKQAEGIAAAKARGVRFGSPRRKLPDNFDQVRASWRNQEMNLKDAAKMCGLPPSTFYEAVRRAEQKEDQAAAS